MLSKKPNEDNDDLIDEYFTLIEGLNLKSFNQVQQRDLNNLLSFVEQKLLKIDSTDEIDLKNDDLSNPIEKRELSKLLKIDSTKSEIDTVGLSKRLNEFLNKHSITKELFNRKIFKISTRRCFSFFSKPEKCSFYRSATQERIKVVNEFLNDNEQREKFLKKYVKRIRDDDEMSQSDDEETPIHPIDTIELSRRLKRFLRQNSIQILTFNRKIVKISYSSLHHFLTRPRTFSQYHRTIQIRLVKIHNFLNDEQRVKRFLEDPLLRGKHGSNSFDQNEGANDSDSVADDDLERSEIDTIDLSKRLNKFLIEHNITKELFNREIFQISSTSFWAFLSKPEKWSFYRSVTQERIKIVEEFLNDEERREEFVNKYGRSVRLDEHITSQTNDTKRPIDTIQLSNRLNRFLTENSISLNMFNRKILKKKYASIYYFLKEPKHFSRYLKSTQGKIVEINKFLNNVKRVKLFLNEYATTKDATLTSIDDDDHGYNDSKSCCLQQSKSKNEEDDELGDDDEFRVEFIKYEDENDILIS